MTALSEAFEKSYDDSLIRAIYRTVQDAIFPFNPGKIQAYTVYDIDFWSHTLKVTVERLPEDVFSFMINGHEMAAYPDRHMNQMYSELFKHYRYRHSLPVEDHILLGED